MDYTRLSMIVLALVNLKKHSLMHCRQPVLPFVNNMKLLSLTFYAYQICYIYTKYLNIHFFVSFSQIKYIYLFVFLKNEVQI